MDDLVAPAHDVFVPCTSAEQGSAMTADEQLTQTCTRVER